MKLTPSFRHPPNSSLLSQLSPWHFLDLKLGWVDGATKCTYDWFLHVAINECRFSRRRLCRTAKDTGFETFLTSLLECIEHTHHPRLPRSTVSLVCQSTDTRKYRDDTNEKTERRRDFSLLNDGTLHSPIEALLFFSRNRNDGTYRDTTIQEF